MSNSNKKVMDLLANPNKEYYGICRMCGGSLWKSQDEKVCDAGCTHKEQEVEHMTPVEPIVSNSLYDVDTEFGTYPNSPDWGKRPGERRDGDTIITYAQRHMANLSEVESRTGIDYSKKCWACKGYGHTALFCKDEDEMHEQILGYWDDGYLPSWAEHVAKVQVRHGVCNYCGDIKHSMQTCPIYNQHKAVACHRCQETVVNRHLPCPGCGEYTLI